jgi:outer membrane protein
MKQIFITAALILAGILSTYSQTEKGKFMVNGALDLSFFSADTETKYNGKKVGSVDTKQFGFDTGASYFVADNFAVGLGLFIASQREEEESEEFTQNSFLIGPTARYYFGTSNIKPFVNGSLMFGSMKEEESYIGRNEEVKYKSFGWDLGAGAAFFLNDNIAIDLGLSYAFVNYENKDDSDLELEADGLGLKVGFSLFF